MSTTDSELAPFFFGRISSKDNNESAHHLKPTLKMAQNIYEPQVVAQNRTIQTNDPCCITHVGNELTNFPATQTVIIYSPLSPANCTPVEIPYNNLYPTYFINRCLKRTNTKTSQSIYVSIEKVCIPHQKIKCQHGQNCHRLHVCRDLWKRLSEVNQWMALEWLAAPAPKRDTSSSVNPPKENPLRYMIPDSTGPKPIENDGECLGPEIDPSDELDLSVHLPRELLQHIEGYHPESLNSYFTPPPKPVLSNQTLKDKVIPPPPLIVKEMIPPAPPAPMAIPIVSHPKSISAKAAATEMYNNLGKMWGKTQNETNPEKHIPTVQPYQPFSSSPKSDTNSFKFTNINKDITYSTVTISEPKTIPQPIRSVVKEPSKSIKIIPVTKKKVEPEKPEIKSIGKIGCFEKLSQLVAWKENGLLCDAEFEIAKKHILAEGGF